MVVVPNSFAFRNMMGLYPKVVFFFSKLHIKFSERKCVCCRQSFNFSVFCSSTVVVNLYIISLVGSLLEQIDVSFLVVVWPMEFPLMYP